MATFIKEPAKDIPVRGEYDLVIVGGGIAGVAAALAATQEGASVCLIEKATGLGGLATLGNVVIYLPLCDGRGRQVVGGLGEELMKAAAADGSGRIPECWLDGGNPAERIKQRYRMQFNPASFILELEARICQAGVRILYDTRFCDVIKNDAQIEAVVIENKSGRGALRCRYVIDATGDADVCVAAGESTVSLNTNVAAGWFYFLNAEGHVELCKMSEPYDCYGETVPKTATRGFDGDEVTDMMLATHAMVRSRIAEFRTKRSTETIYPILLSTLPCFRMTRRLKGRSEIGEDDVGKWQGDAIGLTGDWRRSDPVYAIPYRALTAVKTTNLLTVGRCISVDNTLWDVTRAIPGCAVTGEAAGVAAALAHDQNIAHFQDLPISLLQETLRNRKVILDKNLLTTA